MIKRVAGGYQAFSADGKKPLSKAGVTKAQAEERLKQVEFYRGINSAKKHGAKK